MLVDMGPRQTMNIPNWSLLMYEGDGGVTLRDLGSLDLPIALILKLVLKLEVDFGAEKADDR